MCPCPESLALPLFALRGSRAWSKSWPRGCRGLRPPTRPAGDARQRGPSRRGSPGTSPSAGGTPGPTRMWEAATTASGAAAASHGWAKVGRVAGMRCGCGCGREVPQVGLRPPRPNCNVKCISVPLRYTDVTTTVTYSLPQLNMLLLNWRTLLNNDYYSRVRYLTVAYVTKSDVRYYYGDVLPT